MKNNSFILDPGSPIPTQKQPLFLVSFISSKPTYRCFVQAPEFLCPTGHIYRKGEDSNLRGFMTGGEVTVGPGSALQPRLTPLPPSPPWRGLRVTSRTGTHGSVTWSWRKSGHKVLIFFSDYTAKSMRELQVKRPRSVWRGPGLLKGPRLPNPEPGHPQDSVRGS